MGRDRQCGRTSSHGRVGLIAGLRHISDRSKRAVSRQHEDRPIRAMGRPDVESRLFEVLHSLSRYPMPEGIATENECAADHFETW
jgi:hypothetical protein